MESAKLNYLLLASPPHADVSSLKNGNHVDNTGPVSLVNGDQEEQTDGEAWWKPQGQERKHLRCGRNSKVN